MNRQTPLYTHTHIEILDDSVRRESIGRSDAIGANGSSQQSSGTFSDTLTGRYLAGANRNRTSACATWPVTSISQLIPTGRRTYSLQSIPRGRNCFRAEVALALAASCEFSLTKLYRHACCASEMHTARAYTQHYTLVYATVHIGNVDCCVSIQCGALQQLVVSWKGGNV